MSKYEVLHELNSIAENTCDGELYHIAMRMYDEVAAFSFEGFDKSPRKERYVLFIKQHRQ